MKRHAQSIVTAIKDDKLRLEEDVAPDLESTRGRLNPTKAS